MGMPGVFCSLRNLSDRTISKERKSKNTKGRDDLTDDTDYCVWRIAADDPVNDPDADRDGNENDQCEICGPERNHVERTETSGD